MVVTPATEQSTVHFSEILQGRANLLCADRLLNAQIKLRRLVTVTVTSVLSVLLRTCFPIQILRIRFFLVVPRREADRIKVNLSILFMDVYASESRCFVRL